MQGEWARFSDGPLRDESRFQKTFDRLRTIKRLPCGGELCFLPQDPALAEDFRSACSYDYKPARDIGRYIVLCPFDKVKIHECPWWNAFRKVFMAWNLRGFKVAPGSVKIKQQVGDADADAPWIGYRDGSAGPVLEYYGFELEMPKDIEEIAAECERAAYAAQYPENRGEDLDGVHSDSIPFFERMFGKGKKTC